MAPSFVRYRGLLARINTALCKFSEHNDQTSPGRQGFKRLGRVVVQSTQGRGRVTRQEYRSPDATQPGPGDERFRSFPTKMLASHPEGLRMDLAQYCDDDVQILIYLKDDESPHHTVDNRPKGLANAAG